jgi:diguanylate cyclase (GGDEF)-like protein
MSVIVDRAGLLARIADNPHLPTPPAVALRVLEKASEPDCTLADLEGVISLDPALCVQLLRTVNSALYGLPRAVTSIRLALGLLGTSAVRSLVLSLSLPALQGGPHDSESLRSFWKSSVAGAIVARELAVRLGWPAPEDCLIAGLLRDLGSLLLPRVFPDSARLLSAPQGEPWLTPCEQEEDIYGVNHAEVGAHLLRRWRLPAEITDAVRHHHNPGNAPRATAERAWLLHFATLVAQLQVPSPDHLLWERVKKLAAEHFGLGDAELVKFLEPLDRQMTELAALVRVDPGPWHHYPTVLTAAAELGKLTVEVGFEYLRIREKRDQAEEEAGQWRRAASRLHQEAIRDPLTGCFNRGFFEESLTRSFRRSRRRCTPLGLIFIDLNDFKRINDRHGHAFGDHVLKAVAGRLLSCARSGDVVARYGGDEFCVITTPITEAGLLSMAGRLRGSVSALPLRSATGPSEVRIAVGGAFCLPWRGDHSPAELLGAADAAMYEAKKCAEHGVRLTALIEEEDRCFLTAVESRLFSAFLLGRGKVTARDLAETPRLQAAPSGSLARLARRTDWMPRKELAALLAEQRREGRSFAEEALARGALSQDDLAGLLALRQQPPEAIADDLARRGIMTMEEGEVEMAEFYAALRSG